MPDSDASLQALDEVLAGIRTTQQRPVYRRRVSDGLELSGGFTNLRVLRAIERLSADSKPSISDIATRLSIEHSTASRAVDAVVRGGLATRTTCDDDQRRARLSLTASGRTLLGEATQRRVGMLAEITDGWEPAEIDQLSELLHRLLDGFDRIEGGA